MAGPTQYSLRIAKNIERKMMADVFKRLTVVAPITEYRYVGFGSEYFSDFILFHRSLGIESMVSIETNEQDAQRYELNKPFGCIQLKFGAASEVLPQLNWEKRTIIWLDYEDRLDLTCLSDLRYCLGALVSGSVLIISVNADWRDTSAPLSEVRDTLLNELGEARLPADFSLKDITGWNLAKLYSSIIYRRISETLRRQNKAVPRASRLKAVPLFHFNYRDGARMLTVGILLVNERDNRRFKKAGIADFDYVAGARKAYEIRPPVLTYREIRFLDRLIPFPDFTEVTAVRIPREHAERYQALYRYFPAFAESEL